MGWAKGFRLKKHSGRDSLDGI
ncbi:unnamed protein product [Victoria cruziana]